MKLYRLETVSWQDSQLLYHALPRLGREGLILLSPGSPYVCIGYHQDAAQEVDMEYCREHNIPVFRREVGGGAVYLDGKAIHRLPTRQVAQKLAILPQSPSAPEDLTVRDLVRRGRFARQAWWRASSRSDREAVDWAVRVTGLEALQERMLSTLSGGERQRAWIALALAQEPRVLLLDEPTTFLDISHQLEVMALLQTLNAENGLSIVMVLHDLNQAARFSHRLVALRDGAIHALGQPADVLTEDVLRDVFRVEGVIAHDPHTQTPIFTPLRAVRGNGHGAP